MTAIKRSISADRASPLFRRFCWLPLIVAVVQCGNVQSIAPGIYQGERPVEVKPGTEPIVAKQLARVRLTVKQDGHALLEDAGVPREGALHGRSDGVEFETLSVAGVSIDKQPAAERNAPPILLRLAPGRGWEYPGGITLKPQPSLR